MIKTTGKKEDKPKYETPVVVELDKVDKASGADDCATGSSANFCTAGSAAAIACGAGAAAGQPG
jgi:hypothetical protein